MSTPRNRPPAQRMAGDSIIKLAQEFVEPYGLDVQPPLEMGPFALHDAGHRYSNVPATVYGELLQNVADHATFDKLYGSGAIHGNPGNYLKSDLPAITDRSSFVNYGGSMPDRAGFDARIKSYLDAGVDPSDPNVNPVTAWEAEVNRGITSRQGDLRATMNKANELLSKGDSAFFAGSGSFDPVNGFMPAPDLRNVRGVAPEDLDTARMRGERYADELLGGYKQSVGSGDYRPTRPVSAGMIHAKDLADSAMQGQLRVGRGWADEGIFPYKDMVGQLSNPPAQISRDPNDLEWDLPAAEKARNARALVRTAGAVRIGFNAMADVAGAVPLLDPGFRQAIERGDAGEAAKRVGLEYAAGTALAPVAGAATGVLQRAAPQVAARVLPMVAGVSRVGNPVAVVSQLGGDSRQSPAQVVADKQAAARQLNQAAAARARGSRWKIGPVQIPELGISESGGLFFGGQAQRPLGSRSTLNGRPVVWAGDNYGWQSPASATKIGVR